MPPSRDVHVAARSRAQSCAVVRSGTQSCTVEMLGSTHSPWWAFPVGNDGQKGVDRCYRCAFSIVESDKKQSNCVKRECDGKDVYVCNPTDDNSTCPQLFVQNSEKHNACADCGTMLYASDVDCDPPFAIEINKALKCVSAPEH